MNKTSRLRFAALAASILAASAVLSACGGGGSDSSSATAAAVTGDPIDKYIGGTYTAACQPAQGQVTDDSTGAALFAKSSWSLTAKVSPTQATGTRQVAYYASPSCDGTALYTINLKSTDNFLNVDGSANVGGQNVDKVTVGFGVYFPGFSFGTAMTLNGVRFAGAPYNQQAASTYKDLYLLDAQGRIVVGDPAKPLDADGYPTALKSAASVTRN